MITPDAKALARMHKLLALAQRGVGGEAETAERFLATMLARHGMTIDEIENPAQQRARVSLKYRTPTERKLLLQILAKVLDTTDLTTYRRGRELAIYADLSPAERAEVVMHQAALAPALKRHMARAFSAFVQSNQLYPSPAAHGSAAPPVDPAEAFLLGQMIAASERVAVNRAIESTHHQHGKPQA